jgi:hypothetical protein
MSAATTNTLITPNIVVMEAALALENELVFGNLVYRDLDDDVAPKGKGDTVTVKIPPSLVAEEFNGSAITPLNLVEGSVSVVLDKILSVSTKLTSKELSLSVTDFNQLVTIPACKALARKVDQLIADLALDIPYTQIITSTPVVGDIAGLDRIMNQNKAPMENRNLVLDPIGNSRFITLDAFLHSEKRGDTDAVKNANLGRVLGFDAYMSQQVNSQVMGTWHKTNTLLTASAGATTGTYAAAGSGGTIKKGDLFTVAGITGTYVCTALSTAESDGTGTIAFYPAMASAATGSTFVVSKVGMTATAPYTAGTMVNSIAFHKLAFCLATRPLEAPLGGAQAAVINYNGLSIRVVYAYDIDSKTNIISFDILCGVKTLSKELACRFVNH